MARSRLSTVNFGSSKTGLLTVGFTLYNPDTTVYQARSTAGIREFAATGVYGAQITLPSEKPVLVLWDTGEVAPRYGSEDNNVQLDSIQDSTDIIRLIWNSIRNQGSIFTSLMEKMGLLEKNKGLVKQDLDEAIKGIKFPKQQEIKIPEFPKLPEFPKPFDYSKTLIDLKESVKNLFDSLALIKPQVNKIDTNKIEGMVEDLSKKIDSIPSYETNFKSINKMFEDSISRISTEIEEATLETKSNLKIESEPVLTELRKLKMLFSRFDSLMSKIADFNKNLSDGIFTNRSEINKARKLVETEIAGLKTSLMDRISLMENRPKIAAQNENKNASIRFFGGKNG